MASAEDMELDGDADAAPKQEEEATAPSGNGGAGGILLSGADEPEDEPEEEEEEQPTEASTAPTAGGAAAAREALWRDARAGRDRLAAAEVVVYQFATRELSQGSWPVLAGEDSR